MKKIPLFILLLSSFLLAQRPQEFRAVKLTNVDSNVLFTDQNIAAAMDYLASIGVNVILPVVWNGAYTQYQSAVMDSIFGVKIHPQFAGRDPLERLVIEAHRVGIEVYPWFEYGFAAWYSGSGTATGGHIIQKFPSWAARSSDGKILKKNGFDWMSAINPDVQRFINLLVSEVITKYDVDGVEFSDRIPALPVEGGYDSVTVALYKAEHAGNAPPSNYQDAAWMRWRADKLNGWYSDVRALIKKKSPSLFVSSSPSIYPWSYQEYLQDCKNWIDNGIADHFIPQLYRYSFSEYKIELMNAISHAGIHKSKLFPGILMNIGTGANEYVMSVEYLMNVMKENRANGVNGEAFFYYEGLRKNNGLLGDTLKKTYYKERALVPERGGNEWRFPAVIVNEDDADVKKNGDWSVYQMKGFNGAIMRTSDSTTASSITYRMRIPYPAYYDVYIYRVPNSPWTTKAQYSVLGKNDTSVTVIDQSDLTKKGWFRLRTAFIDSGAHDVVLLNRASGESGSYLTADAVMITINRSSSPDVVTSVQPAHSGGVNMPYDVRLNQNYPNPFNPTTAISYTIGDDGSSWASSMVLLTVYDVLGKKIATLVNERQQPGSYSVTFNASSLASGVYLARLSSNGRSQSIKLVVQK